MQLFLAILLALKVMNKNFQYRDKCDICGSKNAEVILSKNFNDSSLLEDTVELYGDAIEKKDFLNAKYEVHRCPKCNYIYQAYIPTDKFSQTRPIFGA